MLLSQSEWLVWYIWLCRCTLSFLPTTKIQQEHLHTSSRCGIIITTGNHLQYAQVIQKLYSIFVPIIRYTVNVNLVIVSYKEQHESGIGTGTIHREIHARSKVKTSGCLRRLNNSANETCILDEARSFVCSESGESRWKVVGWERVEGGEDGIRVVQSAVLLW